MKTTSIRNPLLALLAMVALLAFILACSSFSPDDSQLLYPTIDPGSGAVGVALYDRESRRSRTLFVPSALDVDDRGPQPLLLRPQWLANGREILVAWPWIDSSAQPDEDGLNIAVLPVTGDGTVRLFQIPELEESLPRILYPLPVAGSGLFFTNPETNSVTRMDLRTGEMRRLKGMDKMFLLPTARGDRLLYLGQEAGSQEMEVGWMEADTGVRTALFITEPLDLGPDEGFFALSHDGRRLAQFESSDAGAVCRLRERGRPDRTLSLGPDAAELTFGNALFSPDGATFYVSILAPSPDPEARSGGLGFLEVPVDGSPVRRTILVRDSGEEDFETAAYFQIGLSGDGRALAVSSTYYAFDDQRINPDNCALFVVDLTDPERSVAKVPMPLPTKHDETDD